MSKPSYDDLLAAFSELYCGSVSLLHGFKREVDCAVYDGASETYDEFREAVHAVPYEWEQLLYEIKERRDEISC